MVNKALDNPKILFTPYSWVPGCLPYYNASLPTHFVVLALPFAAKINVIGTSNAYTKFFAQYPRQPKLLVIYDAIDDLAAGDLMTANTRKALGEEQISHLEKEFIGIYSWLVQPNQHQIKSLRTAFDSWHYSVKYEPLPEPGKNTQFENQVQILK